jgi:hypothetical protein
MSVNWLKIEITDAKGTVTYRNSFITDLPVRHGSSMAFCICPKPNSIVSRNSTMAIHRSNGLYISTK